MLIYISLYINNKRNIKEFTKTLYYT